MHRSPVHEFNASQFSSAEREIDHPATGISREIHHTASQVYPILLQNEMRLLVLFVGWKDRAYFPKPVQAQVILSISNMDAQNWEIPSDTRDSTWKVGWAEKCSLLRIKTGSWISVLEVFPSDKTGVPNVREDSTLSSFGTLSLERDISVVYLGRFQCNDTNRRSPPQPDEKTVEEDESLWGAVLEHVDRGYVWPAIAPIPATMRWLRNSF